MPARIHLISIYICISTGVYVQHAEDDDDYHPASAFDGLSARTNGLLRKLRGVFEAQKAAAAPESKEQEAGVSVCCV